MGLEVELKYVVDPARQVELLAALTQRWGEPETKDLQNLYFDDPQQTLARYKMGLRIRRWADQAEQTLKTAGAVDGARSARPEFNAPCTGERPDLSLIPAEVWPATVVPEQLQAQLVEQFRVQFTRHCWRLVQESTMIEVALDQGAITAGQHSTPVSELELELHEGAEAPLRQIARQLQQEFSLTPGTASKAQRGYALLEANA